MMAAMAVFGLTSCSDDETVPQTEPTYNMAGFAKGADVSWLTQMEASGTKFYDKNGSETRSDCAFGLTLPTDGAARTTS